MRIKRLDLGQGASWYAGGWDLFRQFAAVWILFGIAFLVIAFACFLIPFLGPLLFVLGSPLLAAGFYLGADAVSRGSSLNLSMLFWGFTGEETRIPLLILGGFFLGLMMAASIIMMASTGAGFMGMGPSGAGMGPGNPFWPGLGIGFVLGLTLQVLILMCMFFAIPLVVFDRATPVEAVKTSFEAAARNIIPLLLFLIIYIVLAFIASIPFFLGLIVLFPLAFCSAFCAYKRVFK